MGDRRITGTFCRLALQLGRPLMWGLANIMCLGHRTKVQRPRQRARSSLMSCNSPSQSASNRQMTSKQITGRGRLVPARLTGIAYQVRYGIHIAGDDVQQGRGVRAMQWTKCSVRLPDGGRVPDGSYFLYTDEGKVHQMKSVDGKWHCLAIAA
jgi:hypothetical protein